MASCEAATRYAGKQTVVNLKKKVGLMETFKQIIGEFAVREARCISEAKDRIDLHDLGRYLCPRGMRP